MNKAFTLIELIIVILVIGILAIAAVPKFVDIKKQSVIASEEQIINALRSAVQLRHMEWVINHPNMPNVWPGSEFDPLAPSDPNKSNLFLLIDNPPPCVSNTTHPPVYGVTWASARNETDFTVVCPHGDAAHNKGSVWMYNCSSAPITFYGTVTIQPGAIEKIPQFVHE